MTFRLTKIFEEQPISWIKTRKCYYMGFNNTKEQRKFGIFNVKITCTPLCSAALFAHKWKFRSMWKFSSLFLLLLLLISSAEGRKKINVKDNKKCVGKAGKKIKLGRLNRTIKACRKKCQNDDQCQGIQYHKSKFCTLYYSPISKVSEISFH